MKRSGLRMAIMVFVFAFAACNSPKKEEDKGMDKTQSVAGVFDWRGTWTFTDNAPITYTLIIGDEENEMFVCSYKAEGMQTAYELDCLGVVNGDEFKLYYQGVKEGVFLAADQINRDKSSLTLKRVDGKILTYWDQLFNNYVEEGNHTETVCFQR